MTNTWNEQNPTPEQIEQTKRVETALCNELNLLSREGIPAACILSGLGLTIADLLTHKGDSSAVAPWFEAQAHMIRRLQEPGS
jgi:hypothetical protein